MEGRPVVDAPLDVAALVFCVHRVYGALGEGVSLGVARRSFSKCCYFTKPTIRPLGPGRLIRDISVNPAAFIQRVVLGLAVTGAGVGTDQHVQGE